MGNKVNAHAFRLSTVYGWESKWFAGRDQYRHLLKEDVLLREFLLKELKEAAVNQVEIDRSPHSITVTVHSAKPGFIIGRAGAGVEDLKKKITRKLFPGKKINLTINVQEVTRPGLSSDLVGQQIAADIEKRMPFRRAMKANIERVMKSGAKGVKLELSGRLNGSEIARRERLGAGSIPLQNMRADIDFARVQANTIYGAIGVKVWIYKGDVFDKHKKETDAK